MVHLFYPQKILTASALCLWLSHCAIRGRLDLAMLAQHRLGVTLYALFADLSPRLNGALVLVPSVFKPINSR